MKAATDTFVLFRRPFVQQLRNPSYIFANVSTSIMYLVLFLPLLKKLTGPGFGSGEVIQIFLPGVIAYLFLTTGMYSVWATIFELKKGLIERLRVTPASRFALLMGPILMWAAWTLISATILVVVSIPFGFEVHIAGLLLFAVLLVMLLIVGAAWSTALTILMKAEIIGISAVVTGLNLPLLLTGGVMLPLSLAPGWMRALAHANPLYYAVEAGRDLATGAISTDAVALAFAIITPLTVLVISWAMRVYRKAVA
jgi:ABC-2 type transport system permease protein